MCQTHPKRTCIGTHYFADNGKHKRLVMLNVSHTKVKPHDGNYGIDRWSPASPSTKGKFVQRPVTSHSGNINNNHLCIILQSYTSIVSIKNFILSS